MSYAQSNSWFTKKFDDTRVFKYGFKAAINLPLEADFSMLKGDRSLSGEMGFFFRIGEQYAAEMGLELYFNKRYFSDRSPFLTSMIETRYIQLPIRFRYIFFTHQYHQFHGAVGLIYQQLLQVSHNNVGYSKKELIKSPFLLTIGMGYTYQFLSFELNYRYFLRNFDIDRTKNKQKQLNLSMYLTF